MIQVCIVPLDIPVKATRDSAWAGAQEAAREWNECVELVWVAMRAKTPWPNRGKLQVATKGRYSLHSQTVQMIAKSVLTAFSTAKELRRTRPEMGMRYPYRKKRHHCMLWPAQAVAEKDGKIILPMGKGRADLVLPLGRKLPFAAGACKLLWKDGWELHVSSRDPVRAAEKPGGERATGDLGEIHQVAVTTSAGKALVVSGRGIRSVKRRRCKMLAEMSMLRSRCRPGSRRDRKLARGRRRQSRRTRRQIRDLRHKGLRAAVDFCTNEKVGSLYVGNPQGVRRRNCGAVHNGRMARWECGLDLRLLEHKCGLAGITFPSGTQRGTSSHCPSCQHPQRPAGRNFTCNKCGATVHRDVMGAVNQHRIGFGLPVPVPKSIKYLRPGDVSLRQCAGHEQPAQASSSRPDTGQPENQGLLSCGAGKPGNRLANTAPDVDQGIQALLPNGPKPVAEGRIRVSPTVPIESQEARRL